MSPKKSLLQCLPYKDYQEALTFTLDQCKHISHLANLSNIQFDGNKKPGHTLMEVLDRNGFTVKQYQAFLQTALTYKAYIYYRPKSKIAILIGNEKYTNLSKLATPVVDCESIATRLKPLGFTVVTLINKNARDLKNILVKLLEAIPEDSYCFLYLAGHGCEVYRTTCFLGIDSPANNLQPGHCVSQNFLTSELSKRNTALSVILLDMCRIYLDWKENPAIQNEILNMEPGIPNNIIICSSTLSSEAAYEVLEIACSKTIDNNAPYEFNSGHLLLQGASQYATALCAHIADDINVSAMLDKVHEDLENAPKTQRPLKFQSGTAKRSLHDPVQDDTNILLSKLQELNKELSESGLRDPKEQHSEE